jgi:hypothetical protein
MKKFQKQQLLNEIENATEHVMTNAASRVFQALGPINAKSPST